MLRPIEFQYLWVCISTGVPSRYIHTIDNFFYSILTWKELYLPGIFRDVILWVSVWDLRFPRRWIYVIGNVTWCHLIVTCRHRRGFCSEDWGNSFIRDNNSTRLGPHAIMLKKRNLNIASYFSYNNHKCCRTYPHIPSMYFHVENFHLLAGITWMWFHQSSALGLLSWKCDRRQIVSATLFTHSRKRAGCRPYKQEPVTWCLGYIYINLSFAENAW
jgi:hypothetical protein